MNKRIKLLALLMSFVMVLGVMVAVPVTTSAAVTDTFDIRYAYEFLKASDTDSAHAAIIDSYKNVGHVPDATTAPKLDGVIDEANYTVKNPVLTHSYEGGAYAAWNEAKVETTGVELNEYFAQDADYIYIAFEMPGFVSDLTPWLQIRSTATYGGLSTNHNINAMWNTYRLDIKTDSSTGETTIAGGGDSGKYDMTAWTATGAEVASFTAPTAEDTTAYIEYKIPKSQLMGAMKRSALPDFAYMFMYMSSEEDAKQINCVSNAMLKGSAACTAATGGDYYYKQIFRYVNLADFRYDVPNATTTITSASSVAPNVTDGEIGPTEYTASSTANGVKQYFAIDDNWLYMAFDLGTSLTEGSTPYLRFWAGNDGNAASSSSYAAQYRVASLAEGSNDIVWAWVAGSGGTAASSNNRGWTAGGSVFAGKIDSTTGIVEAKVSLAQLFNSNNGTTTASALYLPYDSLLDMNNIRYDFEYTTAEGTKNLKYTPVGAEATMFGSGVRPRNINFDLREIYEPITDARYDFFQFGYGHTVDGFKTPTMDGVISTDEYTVEKFEGATTKENKSSFDMWEYYAHDAENIYIAFTVPSENGYLRVQASNDGNPYSTYFYNFQIQYDYSDDICTNNGGRNNNANAVSPSSAAAAQVAGHGYKDNGDGTYTFEIALNKNSIMTAYGLSSFNNIRYTNLVGGGNIGGTGKSYIGSNITSTYSAVATALANEWNATGVAAVNSGTLGQSILFIDPEITDVRDLDEWGITSVKTTIDENASKIDVTDATFDPADYSGSRTVVPGYRNGTGTSSQTVSEYYAHDDEWVYVAMTATGYDAAKAGYILFWITDSPYAVDSSMVNRLNFTLGTDGTIGAPGIYNVTNAGTTASVKPVNKFGNDDWAGSFAVDTDGNATIELKLSKAALAATAGLENAYDFVSFRATLRYFEVDETNADGLWSSYHKNLNKNLFAALTAFDAAAGYSFTQSVISRNVDLIYTEFETSDKASARIDQAETSGLRFKSTVSKAYIAELEAQGYTVSVGTLIAPTDYITEGRIDALVHTEDGIENKDYIDVVAYLENPYVNGTTTVTFTGAIVNIKDANLTREFSAVGYIALTKGGETTYVYSDVVASRTISDVAAAELAAPSKDYNETQLAILNKLAGNN